MPRVPDAARTLADVLDRLTAPAARELTRAEDRGRIRCLACGHRCMVLPGQRGICQVRLNRDGELRVPFGYVGALQCDPIEKKPFFHVLPGSDALTFGMLGCDLHCPYCHNWLTSQALRDDHAQVPPEEITATQLADLAVRYDAAMIASSYNEPLITSEWGAAVMDEGRQRGLVRAFVSNGNATPEVLDFLRPHLDCYKVDLKAMRDAGYRQLGAKLESVLETIRGLKRRGLWVEIVTLLVPGLNDSEEEIRDAARFLASVDPLMPWHVTAFHPDYKMTDRAGTAARALVRAAEIGLEQGLRYVYCGNVPGRVGPYEDTRCHGCGATLVRRLGYTILEDRLTPARGSCPECATRIPGIWERPAAIGVTATPGVARRA
ncbi:MAG: AmmeMemoRadiSam system radical SAM enzyme [Chloroflexi bacterium]|nr:AmmeMemoRadiSam system radical SAM enzyme [Chloroflexota bacterium]